MELEGLSAKLTLEEGITSSSSGGEDNNIPNVPKVRKQIEKPQKLIIARFCSKDENEDHTVH